jgi:hypothetical protein
MYEHCLKDPASSSTAAVCLQFGEGYRMAAYTSFLNSDVLIATEMSRCAIVFKLAAPGATIDTSSTSALAARQCQQGQVLLASWYSGLENTAIEQRLVKSWPNIPAQSIGKSQTHIA